MGQNKTFRYREIEAEMPPGCSVARLDEHGEPYLCQPGGDPIVYCYTAGPLEIFTATVIMQWDDIIMAEQNDTLVARAEAQAEKWRQIRAAAIEGQKP